MRQPRAAVALFAATLAHTNAAAVVASAARGFLAQLAQPDLVASKLLAIEDDWKAQVRIFAECVARGGAEASGTTCGRVQSLFQQSCSAISAAFIQGQGGDPNGVSRFMDGVCAGAAADHDHQELCAEFKEELLRGISAGGQDGLTGVSSCQRLWVRLLNKDQQALQSSNQTSTKEQGRTTATQPEHKHLEDKAVGHWHAEQHEQANGKAHQNVAVVQPAKGLPRVESSKQPQRRELLADKDSNISQGVHATLPPTPGGAVTRSLQVDEAKAALDGARAKAKHKVATPERNPSGTRSINHIDSDPERQASAHAGTSKSEESVSKRMSGRKSDLHGQGELHRFEHRHQVPGAVAESNPEASEQALLARWRQEQSRKHRRVAAKAATGSSPATVLHASEARRHQAEDRATAAQKVLEKALAAEQHIKEVSTERKKRRMIKEIEDRKRWAAEARERRRKLQEERTRKMGRQEHARAGKGEEARGGQSDNATGGGRPRAQPNASRVLVRERLGQGAAPGRSPGPEAPAAPAPHPSPAKRQRAAERAAAAKRALEEAETEERRVKAAALSLAAQRQRAAGAGVLGAAAGRRTADAEETAEEAEAGDAEAGEDGEEESEDSTSEEEQDTAKEDSGDAASKDQKSEAEQEEEDDGDDNHADDDS